MPKLDMNGSYDLSRETIDSNVTRKSAGNYALGFIRIKSDGGKTFVVKYVGRSDTDVAGRLKQHLGEGYTKFKYSYATSPKAAFEKECKNYHDFGEDKDLDNEVHPRRPDGTGWKCPCCEIFGR